MGGNGALQPPVKGAPASVTRLVRVWIRVRACAYAPAELTTKIIAIIIIIMNVGTKVHNPSVMVGGSLMSVMTNARMMMVVTM